MLTTTNNREHALLSTRSLWEQCLLSLQQELPSQQYNTWIKPLTVDGCEAPLISPLSGSPLSELQLLAPNRFILDWVKSKFLQRINELVNLYYRINGIEQQLQVVIATEASQQPNLRYTLNDAATTTTVCYEKQHEEQSSPQKVSTSETNPGTFSSAKVGPATGKFSKPTTSPILTNDYQNQNVNPVNQQDNRHEIKPKSNRPVVQIEGGLNHRSGLNQNFTFKSFVEGKSNQMGHAAAMQIAENPGGAYNPLFIYGGVGLGKTHLMHAVGNELAKRNHNAKIVYLHSERFVADMVKALQLNAINDFKRYYRSVDALLIDDIQFFAGKDRSQEEFFHTFNALLEGNQQIILTCDRYPKVINNLEERLKSRFGWGLTVEVEPPELETRVAILIKKAEEVDIELSHEAAFFIAQRIRSNVRELEGALKRVIANSKFTSRPISVDLVREALKDLLALQDKQVSIHNIQRVVGEYYKVKIGDFISKRRSRSVARPRQVAMSLAKELTNYSLPEIGDAFGGRDHTTVLHACRKIKELCDTNSDMQQDLKNLQRLLTT